MAVLKPRASIKAGGGTWSDEFQQEIIQSLPPNEIALLKPLLQSFTCVEKQVLIKRNSHAKTLYLLESGLVVATRGLDSPYRAVHVALLGRGDMIGYNSLIFMGEPSGLTYTAHTAGSGYAVSTDALAPVIDQCPTLRLHCGSAAQELMEQVAETVVIKGNLALEFQLLRWLFQARARLGNNMIPVLHDQLAEAIGKTRSAISLALNTYQAMGILDSGYGWVRLSTKLSFEKIVALRSRK